MTDPEGVSKVPNQEPDPVHTTASLASIIIPNWNGIHHLPSCLDALRAQSYSHTEIILVDNGSTDGSQAFVTEKYPEVRLLALERNLGLSVLGAIPPTE